MRRYKIPADILDSLGGFNAVSNSHGRRIHRWLHCDTLYWKCVFVCKIL